MKKFKLFPLLLVFCLVLAAFAPSAAALDEPELNAKAAVLVDLNTGRVLLSKNAEEPRSMASLTKIMTVLLAIESVERGEHSMDETVTAQSDCQTGMDEDSSSAYIMEGEQMSFKDLLYCALIHSANDACNVLASCISGSIDAFVEQMNRRAAELGCTDTVFADPNGLSSENHSTAYDLYLISAEAINHPDFMTICNTAEYTVPATNLSEAREFSNSNALISSRSIYGWGAYLYEYAAGVKTGFTQAAGYCLVSTAEKEGVRTLAVVMGCDGNGNAGIDEYKNFDDSIKLYNWVFDHFSYRTILTTQDPIQKAPVTLAKGDGTVTLQPQADVNLLLPTDLDSGALSTSVTLYEEKLVAPIAAGTVLGEAKLTIDGQDYGTVKLVNSAEVELARGEYLKQRLAAVFSNGWVIAAILIILVLGGIYIALVIRYRRLRKKHLRQRRLMEQRRRAEQERLYKQSREGSGDEYFTGEEPAVDYTDTDDYWK